MLSSFHSEGEQLIRVFKNLWPGKESLLEALMSWTVALSLTGNDLIASLLFSFSWEVLEACHEGLPLPLVDGFLQRKEVWDMEKLARQSAGDYFLWEKGITNPLTGRLKVSFWPQPLRGLLEAGRKEIEWLNRLWWTSHLKDIQKQFLEYKNKHTF